MNRVWNISLSDYLEAVKRAKANGKSEGESFEEEFLEVMNEKNIQPVANTELTKDELIKEYASHGKNILSVETKEDGETQFKITKLDKPNSDMV